MNDFLHLVYMFFFQKDLFSQKQLLLIKSRIPKMTVCGVKIGNIKVF